MKFNSTESMRLTEFSNAERERERDSETVSVRIDTEPKIETLCEIEVNRKFQSNVNVLTYRTDFIFIEPLTKACSCSSKNTFRLYHTYQKIVHTHTYTHHIGYRMRGIIANDTLGQH